MVVLILAPDLERDLHIAEEAFAEAASLPVLLDVELYTPTLHRAAETAGAVEDLLQRLPSVLRHPLRDTSIAVRRALKYGDLHR